MRQCSSGTIARVAEIRKNLRTECSGEGREVGGGQRNGTDVLYCRVGRQVMVTGKFLSFRCQDEIQADYCL